MNPASRHLAIDGDMTIYRAQELKELLLSALDGAAAVDIDLSGVAEIDTAGIQLLMLAKRTAGEKGSELRLLAHSPAVLDVLDLLNLAAYFGDPVVLPSDAR